MATLGILIWFAYLAKSADALIHTLDFPEDWAACLRGAREKLPCDKEPGSSITTTCLNWYLYSHKAYTPQEDTPEYNNFKEKFCKVDTYQGENVASPPKLFVRKEIRMMSDKERRTFYRAVNKAKIDGVYANIVKYHAERNASMQAHNGPAFLCWHRIYLLQLEKELRKYEPEVVIPYWDPRIDEILHDEEFTSVRSRIWNRKFFGHGNEIVTNGPWRSPNEKDLSKKKIRQGNWKIRRRIGQNRLPSGREIQQLFKAKSISDVTVPNWLRDTGNIEYLHNDHHMFVGGDMSSLLFAPEDPIFFILHCFYDYLWEELRLYFEREHQVNPEEDYPDVARLSPNFRPFHRKDAPMQGFPGLRNIDGSSKNWTKYHYTYEKSPFDRDCSKCAGHDERFVKCVDICGKHLRCRFGKCSARLLTEKYMARFEQTESSSSRKRRDADTLQVTDYCQSGVCQNANPAIQNDFISNGKDDSGYWKWLPIKVLYRRPKGVKYNAYAVHGDIFDTSKDIYNQELLPELEEKLNTSKPGTYKHCAYDSKEAFVVVRSDCLSAVSTPQIETCPISGKYPFDEEYVYIAVPSPMNEAVNVSFLAYDQCGRLCTPYCKQIDGNFRKCTGLFHLDDSYTGYGSNPSEVVFKQLSEKNGMLTLSSYDENLFLMFDCNSASEYYFNEFL